METVIKSGDGGNVAKVDENSRLHAQAVTETESLHATETGNAFNLNTGLISITGDATICYLKNTDPEARDFVVSGIAFGIFGGITYTSAAFPYITIIDTPTAGDLITDATTTGVFNRNRNFGSSNELEGLFYKGKVSGTATGGNDVGILLLNATGRSFFSLDLALKKNASIAVDLTSNLSSGSANVYCALIGYYKDKTSRD